MLINEYVGAALSTKSVLLVPYSDHHVPYYHEWMQDPEIQEATASEPLTLPQEYAMQKSWRMDVDKLTFIVCTPLQNFAEVDSRSSTLHPGKHDNPSTMLGDVNLFLSADDEDDTPGNGHSQRRRSLSIIGELELMIADKAHQGCGYGRRALLAFLRYIIDHDTELSDEFMKSSLTSTNTQHTTTSVPTTSEASSMSGSKLSCLRARIGATNTRSIALFTKLGFEKVNDEPNYFGEFELRRYDLSRQWVDELFHKHGVGHYCEIKYAADDPE